jgi:hypothetical protein
MNSSFRLEGSSVTKALEPDQKRCIVKRLIPVVLVGAFGFALAAQTVYTLSINGKPSSLPAIVVKGETYVPLTALKAAGVGSSINGNALALTLPGSSASPTSGQTTGGANQRASLEGCINETLFNGIWRLTVKSAKPISRYNNQQPGYGLSLEWKNGAKATANALNTGIKSLNLVLEDGTVLLTEEAQNLTNKSLPQGAGIALDLAFYAESGTPSDTLSKPAKFLVEIDPKVLSNTGISAAYTAPNPSFRVRLDCQK